MALERVIGAPKRGVGESTLNQIYTYGKTNRLCLEDSIIKILEKGDFKPKIKTALSRLINMITKWREDSLKMKHFDLLKLAYVVIKRKLWLVPIPCSLLKRSLLKSVSQFLFTLVEIILLKLHMQLIVN